MSTNDWAWIVSIVLVAVLVIVVVPIAYNEYRQRQAENVVEEMFERASDEADRQLEELPDKMEEHLEDMNRILRQQGF